MIRLLGRYRLALAGIILLTIFWVWNDVRWSRDEAFRAAEAEAFDDSIKELPESLEEPLGVDVQNTPGVPRPTEPSDPPDAAIEHGSQTSAVPTTEELPDKIVVMGRLESEDGSWVARDLPDWQNAIYVVDNPNATLHTPINKGKEANPYLTYLIENYDNLPSIIAFLHSHRDGYPQAWHTDAIDYSNVKSLQALRLDYVRREGYVNLRCIDIPGCPADVQPFRDPPDHDHVYEYRVPEIWEYLFNNTDVPHVLAVPCCAQFVVTRGAVLRRPHSDYVRFREWLYSTDIPDEESGRIMEYLWHVIFGKDPVLCLPLQQCYCEVYGRCEWMSLKKRNPVIGYRAVTTL
ncbi:hypothetical protein BDY21DRAFT_302959 [Lineolata rhizophorae]|uniref:Uncharacterized protein n=1 Tax=Lineolata rhizophorae TaxID=578093 RepID=A0A6A6P217_9PEZI|nr:hypothetical protein BDY21DRAFT_302959 [Lineolata rhizophorae]